MHTLPEATRIIVEPCAEATRTIVAAASTGRSQLGVNSLTAHGRTLSRAKKVHAQDGAREERIGSTEASDQMKEPRGEREGGGERERERAPARTRVHERGSLTSFRPIETWGRAFPLSRCPSLRRTWIEGNGSFIRSFRCSQYEALVPESRQGNPLSMKYMIRERMCGVGNVRCAGMHPVARCF